MEPVIDKDSKTDKAHSVSSNTDNGELFSIRVPRPQLPKRPSVSRGRLKSAFLLVALLISLGMGFLGGYLGAAHHDQNQTGTASLSTQKKIVSSQSQLISEIAKTVGPSVVSIDVIGQAASANPYGSLFGGGGSQQQSAGTGVILTADGLILTNRHVVPAGTSDVSITLSDGTQLKDVQVVGRTNDSDSLDIAFLKVKDAKGHKLTPVVLGDSSKVQVGDAVVAIGNALGQFQNTVTSGIISGFGRSVQAGDSSGQQAAENLDDLLQTDAAINEGNSGGPLVNLNGQVIGINTAIASNSQNIGFTIPINDVTGLIKQVKATGKLVRPYLGVRYIPLTPDVANYYSINVDSGSLVVPSTDPSSPSVISGSPADKAGLKEKDVITAVDGIKIDQTHSITSVISQHSVGDTIKITVLRGGKSVDLKATLTAAPGSN